MRISLTLVALIGLSTLVLRPLFHQPAVRAGTALRMEVNELVERAELVVEGRIMSARGVETEAGMIETEYQMQVDRTFEGEDIVDRTLRLPGGILEDGRGLLLVGLPRLQVGEEALLFLSAASSTGVRMPVGLSQGRYRILRRNDGSRLMVRDQTDLGLVDQDSGHVAEADSRHVRNYAELIAEVEAAVVREDALGPRTGASTISGAE